MARYFRSRKAIANERERAVGLLNPGGEVSGVPGWNAAQAVLEDLS